MNDIYMDHAATTPVNQDVIKAMQPFYSDKFANPASSHLPGQKSAAALEDAREAVAKLVGTKKAEEIVFTAGGTEADNLALKGAAMALSKQGKHIITSAIEHHAVLKSCEYLEKHLGFEITYLEVDQAGLVDPQKLRDNIRKDTILISIMFANNEIGSVQPIKELAAVAGENNILFHTDAVQAVGQLKIDVNELGVDLLSLSAHKFNGPKGIGALFVRKGVELTPQMSGGSQERKRRAGTANLTAAVGMGKAAEIAAANLTKKSKELILLRDYFFSQLKSNFDNLKINGPAPKSENRLPANINIAFKDLDAESILFNLSLNNIAAATGSACASGSLSVSHVLKAIGLEDKYAKGSIRFSLGKGNNKEEIDYVIKKLKEIIARLNSLK
ncbi:cysteine desulfurase [Halanaerobium saccharolyticum]|uniref:cysteine desulfurase n=1 Tax=Halanaerobium saccharolyticum TaxID=43595 RepID=A0A4R7Z4S7_9FIRM|nr:cysteine desulfurase family protein [Halanaerobium saccharolyticum]RAK10386.1 cysteine desulfurase [Halanaerobium saccharolyticum]TDW05332.1 cysteine desulfurase [Halanaerobium saccharolyticum]TDX60402.1 cysteine desulfurase [Halanaerobium saccharolyticum]